MRFFAILILACIPVMGNAQSVIVRSGEHADFSRLAFEFPGPIGWEMGRVEHGYEIRLLDSGSDIDLSEVYDRISRDRIKDLVVSEDRSRVTLDLGCDCYADAFEFRPGLLVVDIKDGKPPTTSRFETIFNSGELTVDQHVAVQNPETRARKSSTNTGETPVVTLPLTLPNSHTQTKPNVGLFSAKASKVTREPTYQVVEMQAEIIQQIGRAASQGLLDANLPIRVQALPTDHEVDAATAVPSFESIAKPQVNIHIQSSIDREFMGLANQNQLTGNGSKCLPNSVLNVAEWGDEDAVLARVSEQRTRMLGEFDFVEAQEVKALVQAYLYAGFGVEALEVLSAFDVTMEGENLLKAVAQIVDGKTPSDHAKLAGQASCDSASAMWAVLAASDLSKLDQINSASILGEFSSLPFHLRRLLGPALAQKFLDSGDIETARGLRNAIARASSDAGSEFRLLDAHLDLERGRNESAEQMLEGILADDSEVAPMALVTLLEVRLQNEEEIDARILATAESYIFEQLDTKIAANLKRLIALALGQAGDFLAALDALNELESFEKLTKNQKGIVWGKIVNGLIEKAPEDILLKFVFASQDDMARQNIPREIRRKLALRLIKEGWPEKAEQVLGAPRAPTASDRIILAQALISKGHTEQVLKMLENVAGDEAAQIRALAYERTGNYSAAMLEYKILKDGKNQKAVAWRAEDWVQLATIGSEVDQAAAQLMLPQAEDEAEAVPAKPRTLGMDLSLLTKSEEERRSIEQMLKKYSHFSEEGV